MVKSNIDIKQLKKIIQKLPAKDRTQLIKDLQEENWRKQFREIISVLRSKTTPPSLRKITAIAKEVRKQLYEERIKGSH